MNGNRLTTDDERDESERHRLATAMPVPTPNWVKHGTVIRLLDADTLEVRLDLGRYSTKILAQPIVRLAGLYAPERREPGGPEALAHLGLLAPVGAPVVVQTRKPDPRDPYGRVVADVWNADGAHLATAMIAAGHGTPTP